MTPIALTVRQASEFVSLSRASLYRRVKDGTLPAIKLGGRTLFRVEDLERMVNDAPRKD